MERQPTETQDYDDDVPSISVVTASARKSALPFASNKKRARETDETLDSQAEEAGDSQAPTPSIGGPSETPSRTPMLAFGDAGGDEHILLTQNSSPRTVARTARGKDVKESVPPASSPVSVIVPTTPSAGIAVNLSQAPVVVRRGPSATSSFASPKSSARSTTTKVHSATTTPTSHAHVAKHVSGSKSSGLLLAAAAVDDVLASVSGEDAANTVPATPLTGVQYQADIPTPQTVLTQLTQEAQISQALAAVAGIPTISGPTQLSAGGSSSDVLSSQQNYVSQPADDVTPLAAQLARVNQPMTVGREAEGTGEYAPPSPNVDLFTDFGFTPFQSQTEMPQLRRQHNQQRNASSSRVRPSSTAPNPYNNTNAVMSPPAVAPQHTTGGEGDAASPTTALELSPMTNTQRERRERDSWCIMAKNFFDFIDQQPLKVVSAVQKPSLAGNTKK